MKRKFRSCFIVDVQIDDKIITLTDSSHERYYIDIKNTELIMQFKNWLTNSFKKGIAQSLTVFEYIDIGESPDIEFHIVSFCNVQVKNEKQLNG